MTVAAVSVWSVLVVIETFLLALLGVMVFALLRAYADVQYRLEELRLERPSPSRVGGTLSDRIPHPRPEPNGAGAASGKPAPSIAGVNLLGDAYHVDLAAGGPNTLIAFLTSGCTTCQSIWRAIDEDGPEGLPEDARLIIVTKDSSEESPSKLLELAPRGVPVVCSSPAWEAYDVSGSPFFVYVDGASGTVAGEGAAEEWDQIRSLLTDAVLDSAIAAGHQVGDRRESPAAARARRAEEALIRAGIPMDDPSLWGGQPPPAREPT